MLLRSEFPNGPFGDPALYVWEIHENDAMLLDCGDLSRFSVRQLLKARYVFVSHCHMDHFFGFDFFLRVHMGRAKRVTFFGPPRTSDRVRGKLQGYTWNLIHDQDLVFVVVDLDAESKTKRITRFSSKDGFEPEATIEEKWNPDDPILDEGTYTVRCALLDHRTPSMAYSVEEKQTLRMDSDRIRSLGLKPGAWILDVKNWRQLRQTGKDRIVVPDQTGIDRIFPIEDLARQVLLPRQRHRLVYATDGAASLGNQAQLLNLASGADVFYCETCFLEEDARLAHDTKHFTARYIGEICQRAGVKCVVPFHFSKRYHSCPGRVWQEVESHFSGIVHKLGYDSFPELPPAASG